MVLLVERPYGRDAEWRYVLDVLLGEFLGLPYATETRPEPTVRIRLADGPAVPCLTIASHLLDLPDVDWLTALALPARPLERADVGGGHLPVLFGKKRGEHWVSSTPDGVEIGIDVFGSAFFLLTRYEELVVDTRDGFDRFPAFASLAAQEGFLDRPLVNEYAELLWASMGRLWPALRRKDRQYRLLVSHDLDQVSLRGRTWPSVARSLGADLLQRREPAVAIRRARAYVRIAQTGQMVDGDPYNTFDFVMDVSERHGVRSAFNVVASRGEPRHDPDYDIDDPWLRKLLRRIDERGHEIGVHGSFLTYRDPARLRAELHRLRRIAEEEGIHQEVKGGRQHYLRWHNPITWRAWEEAGLTYDSSLGYSQQTGFRSGTCYEFPVFDLLQRRTLNLRERPLIVMESTLLYHMGLSHDVAEDTAIRLASTCRRYKGDFTLLWHNHLLVGRRDRSLYQRLVAATC
jgi:peptidoglycan/xylan/chitin deacetylase (PgdA/CDA1 family)